MNYFGYLFFNFVSRRRKNGQEGFIPANYVKEIEPAKVKKVAKKKEIVKVPVKVKKTRIEKRYIRSYRNFCFLREKAGEINY